MTQEQIHHLKLEMDKIKEYINSELCKKCEEMTTELRKCEQLLQEYSNNS
jgi:hypothetical protein